MIACSPIVTDFFLSINHQAGNSKHLESCCKTETTLSSTWKAVSQEIKGFPLYIDKCEVLLEAECKFELTQNQHRRLQTIIEILLCFPPI